MLIGLNGRKHVGKDTFADYLVQRYGFIKTSMSDKMYEAVCNLFGLTLEQAHAMKTEDSIGCKGHVIVQIDGIVEWDFTWREFLQRFGTQMGRNTFGEDFWLEQWKRIYDPKLNMVNTSVRFANEARAIRALGGYVIEITRPNFEPDGHESEAHLPEDLIDAWIDNTGTLSDLYRDAEQLVEDIRNVAIVPG